MRPLHDYVVVKLIDSEEKESLIFVPEDAQEKRPIGEVVAVGPGKVIDDGNRIPMSVSPGDKILFHPAKGASQPITVNGEEYFVMAESSIFLILE